MATAAFPPPSGGHVVKEVTLQRAALLWIHCEPEDAFPEVRLMRGGAAVEDALRPLRDGTPGFVAQVEPGIYAVEGRNGERVARVEATAKAAEVTEVWLRAREGG